MWRWRKSKKKSGVVVLRRTSWFEKLRAEQCTSLYAQIHRPAGPMLSRCRPILRSEGRWVCLRLSHFDTRSMVPSTTWPSSLEKTKSVRPYLSYSPSVISTNDWIENYRLPRRMSLLKDSGPVFLVVEAKVLSSRLMDHLPQAVVKMMACVKSLKYVFSSSRPIIRHFRPRRLSV